MCGGGGGSSAPSQQTVTQVTIPPEIMPYAKKLLGTAESLTYNKPYETFGGQRVAGLNPLQEQALNQIQQQQVAPQIGQATGFAGLAGLQAQQLGQYNPAQYQGMDVSYLGATAPQLQQYQMEGPERVAAQTDFGTVTAPNLQDLQMAGPQQVGAAQVAGAQMAGPQQITAPSDLERLQMGPAERVGTQGLEQYQMGPARDVQAERFGLSSLQPYMSPYMQDVVELQKQKSIEDYARQLPGLQAAGVRSGARGGTREALLQSEARRGLRGQLADIQATGTQRAFEQAQQQYGADRAAAMQAQLANQAAGLTVGQQNLAARLGVQQLGAQQGLQAALANQAAGMQVGQQNLAAAQARQQLMAQQGLEAQRLNQAAGLTAGQVNLQAQMQAQLANQQAQQQAALANQAAGLTTGQQNLAARLQTQNLAADTGLRAQLANQQARVTGGQMGLQAALANQQAAQQAAGQNLQARLGVQALGAQTGMQAQLANQQAQLAAQQAALQQRQFGAEFGERSRQFGKNLGIQANQQQLAAAQALGGLGQTQFAQQQGINQAQMAAGSQLQQMEQARLQAAYEDFLNRQRYPYQQLGFMSDLIRGTPTAGGIQSIYGSQSSPLGALAGLGGLYMAGKQG